MYHFFSAVGGAGIAIPGEVDDACGATGIGVDADGGGSFDSSDASPPALCSASGDSSSGAAAFVLSTIDQVRQVGPNEVEDTEDQGRDDGHDDHDDRGR